jgi:hypothetical protein
VLHHGTTAALAIGTSQDARGGEVAMANKKSSVTDRKKLPHLPLKSEGKVIEPDPHAQVMDLVDQFTIPDKMNWREASGFLEELIDELQNRLEVLKEENE